MLRPLWVGVLKIQRLFAGPDVLGVSDFQKPVLANRVLKHCFAKLGTPLQKFKVKRVSALVAALAG